MKSAMTMCLSQHKKDTRWAGQGVGGVGWGYEGQRRLLVGEVGGAGRDNWSEWGK